VVAVSKYRVDETALEPPHEWLFGDHGAHSADPLGLLDTGCETCATEIESLRSRGKELHLVTEADLLAERDAESDRRRRAVDDYAALPWWRRWFGSELRPRP